MAKLVGLVFLMGPRELIIKVRQRSHRICSRRLKPSRLLNLYGFHFLHYCMKPEISLPKSLPTLAENTKSCRKENLHPKAPKLTWMKAITQALTPGSGHVKHRGFTSRGLNCLRFSTFDRWLRPGMALNCQPHGISTAMTCRRFVKFFPGSTLGRLLKPKCYQESKPIQFGGG